MTIALSGNHNSLLPSRKFLLRTVLTLAILPIPYVRGAELAADFERLDAQDYTQRTEARETIADEVKLATAPAADPATAASLREALLAHSGPEKPFAVRDWAIRQLALLGNAEVVPGLAGYLDDPDPKIRDLTRKTLSKIPDPAATEALLARVGTAATEQDLIGYLNAIARSAEPALGIALLKNQAATPVEDSPEVAAAAINALAAMELEEARQALLALDGSVSPAVAGNLEQALMVCPLTVEQARRLAAEGTNLAVRTGAFKQLLQHDTAAAMGLLGETAFPARADFLKAATAHPDAANVISAAFGKMSADEQLAVLGAVKDQRLENFRPVLRDILISSDTDAELRELALLCAIRVPSQDLLEPMFDRYPAAPKPEQNLLRRAMSAVHAPELDQRLQQMTREGSPEEKAHAIRYLSFRNPEGTLEVVHAMLREDLSPMALESTLAAAESLGSLETIRLMIDKVLITADPESQRKVQISLKRTALNLDAPAVLWEKGFEPVLENNDTSAADKAQLIRILDCAPASQTLQYLKEAALSGEPALTEAALGNLARWRDYNVGEICIELAQNEVLSPAERENLWKQAVRAMEYTTNRPGIHRRIEYGVKLFQAADDDSIKQSVLQHFAELPERHHDQVKKQLTNAELNAAEKDLFQRLFP